MGIPVRLAAPKGRIRIIEDESTGELYIFGVDANGDIEGNPAMSLRDHGAGIEFGRGMSDVSPLFKRAADGGVYIVGLTP